MKMSAKKLLVIFAIVLTFSAVQTAWALEITVSGTIDRIGTSSIDVVTSTVYTFYHIPVDVLATLKEGDSVTISAY